ncbi:MAG: hypothetical protein LBR07_06705 [Puniceicoccales bacterium]|jgi:hypothetical protein|nr:hypothetical protein [Puniceicoccales bacterium]
MSDPKSNTDAPSRVAGSNWARNFTRPGTVTPTAEGGKKDLASMFGSRPRTAGARAPRAAAESHSNVPAAEINVVTRLFPNTGHQYFFQPFEIVPGDGGWRVPAEIVNLCNRRDTPWTSVPDKPWLLFKLTHLGAHDGLLLAIETNIGDKNRGFLLHSFPPEDETELREDPSERSAYVFPNSQGLADAVSTIDLAELVAGLASGENITVNKLTPAKLQIGWANAAAAATRDVHLIVDFGNSRTVALLLEDDPDAVSAAKNALAEAKKLQELAGTARKHHAAAVKSTQRAEKARDALDKEVEGAINDAINLGLAHDGKEVGEVKKFSAVAEQAVSEAKKQTAAAAGAVPVAKPDVAKSAAQEAEAHAVRAEKALADAKDARKRIVDGRLIYGLRKANDDAQKGATAAAQAADDAERIANAAGAPREAEPRARQARKFADAARKLADEVTNQFAISEHAYNVGTRNGRTLTASEKSKLEADAKKIRSLADDTKRAADDAARWGEHTKQARSRFPTLKSQDLADLPDYSTSDE